VLPAFTSGCARSRPRTKFTFNGGKCGARGERAERGKRLREAGVRDYTHAALRDTALSAGPVGIQVRAGVSPAARNSGNRRNDAANMPNLFMINDAEAIL